MLNIKHLLTALSFSAILAISGCARFQSSNNQFVLCPTTDNYVKFPVISKWHLMPNKQKDLKPKLEGFINSGDHNIVSVQTTYTDAYLTSAEITYSLDNDCKGNNLRVALIHSNKRFWHTKQNDVRPRLEKMITGDYDILDIKEIRIKKYLVAAEVYYLKN